MWPGDARKNVVMRGKWEEEGGIRHIAPEQSYIYMFTDCSPAKTVFCFVLFLNNGRGKAFALLSYIQMQFC